MRDISPFPKRVKGPEKPLLPPKKTIDDIFPPTKPATAAATLPKEDFSGSPALNQNKVTPSKPRKNESSTTTAPTPNKPPHDVTTTCLVKRTFAIMDDGGGEGAQAKRNKITICSPNSTPNKMKRNPTQINEAATKSNAMILRKGVMLGAPDGANLKKKTSPPPVPQFIDDKVKKDTLTDLGSVTVHDAKKFKTVGTQTAARDSVRISKRTANKVTIPYGAIVRLNGSDFDLLKYPDRAVAPYFLGTVENPYDHSEDEIVANMTDNDSVIKIILAGRYEWIKKMEEHSCVRVYSNDKLTMIKPPPADDARLSKQEKKGFLRWFSKTPGMWKIKQHDNPCHNCASPFCIFKFHTGKLKKVIGEAKAIAKHVPNNQKRHFCYVNAAKQVWGSMGENNRRQLGWCFENAVRRAFPDDSYTGFKNVLNFETEEGESSSDESVLYYP